MINLHTIKWHLIAIVTFIFIETCIVFFIGTNATFIDFAAFYFFEILFFYGNALWILPKFESFNIPQLIKIISIFSIIVLYAGLYFLIQIILYSHHNVPLKKEQFTFIFIKSVARNIYIFCLSISFWYAKRLISQQKIEKLRILEIAQQKEDLARMEIALLRSQMNPHLMINALSSIQGVLMEKAPETLKLIYTLVEVQATSLDLSNPSKANTLGDEILAVRQIIDLFSMLGKKPNNLYIHVEDIYKGYQFPGHVLVTIVENVFKHADFNNMKEPPRIQIKTEKNMLHVLIQNKVAKQELNDDRKKYGMEHVLRELTSVFKDRYIFKESNKAGFYELDLSIQL